MVWVVSLAIVQISPPFPFPLAFYRPEEAIVPNGRNLPFHDFLRDQHPRLTHTNDIHIDLLPRRLQLPT